MAQKNTIRSVDINGETFLSVRDLVERFNDDYDFTMGRIVEKMAAESKQNVVFQFKTTVQPHTATIGPIPVETVTVGLEPTRFCQRCNTFMAMKGSIYCDRCAEHMQSDDGTRYDTENAL